MSDKRIKSEDDGSLTRWSDIMQRQSEQRRAEEERILTEMRKKLDETKREVCALPNEQLLEHFRSYSSTSYADPRRTALIQEVGEVARVEILRRMV